jgi:hypothetical protein
MPIENPWRGEVVKRLGERHIDTVDTHPDGLPDVVPSNVPVEAVTKYPILEQFVERPDDN